MTTTVGSRIGDLTVDVAGADLSEDGVYRYRLWRHLHMAGNDKTLLFVMLNPSTADARLDDPTIRKCVGFAKNWRFGSVMVVNLFAWRATDPDQLKVKDADGEDVIGPENDKFTKLAVDDADKIIVAWGTKGTLLKRNLWFANTFAHRELWALKVSKEGHPNHPLYMPYSSELVRWGVQ